MKEGRFLTKTGFWITVQNMGEVNHISIWDTNLYPADDSRSQLHLEYTPREFTIPINSKDDLRAISHMFKEVL